MQAIVSLSAIIVGVLLIVLRTSKGNWLYKYYCLCYLPQLGGNFLICDLPCQQSTRHNSIEDYFELYYWLFACICFYICFRLYNPESAVILPDFFCSGIYPCFFAGSVLCPVGTELHVFRNGIPEYHGHLPVRCLGMANMVYSIGILVASVILTISTSSNNLKPLKIGPLIAIR